jgi:hypothetical protein
MPSQNSTARSHRNYGRFFVFLAIFSLALAGIQLYWGRWGLATLLLPGVLFFGALGYLIIVGTTRRARISGGSSGGSGVGVRVPVSPAPTHHLQAAKDLPPSDKTHSFPKD